MILKGLGRGRRWTAMQSQQRLPLSPQGALKLAWPISVVSCWRKGGGGKSKAGELLSSVSIQSLDVGYPLEEVTLGEATLF